MIGHTCRRQVTPFLQRKVSLFMQTVIILSLFKDRQVFFVGVERIYSLLVFGRP